MANLVARFKKVAFRHRLAWIFKREEELNTLSVDALDECGRLLCCASSRESRMRWPIIGEHETDEQASFEVDVYGDPSNPETTVAPSLRADIDPGREPREDFE